MGARGCRNRPAPGQEATEEQSNAITASLKLLELLELKACIATIDAMGCRTKIVAQGGDDVLGPEAPQGRLE